MSGLTVSGKVATVGLDPNGVLKQAWSVYKRLLSRSLVMGAIVFGVLHLLEAVARGGRSGPVVTLLTFTFGFVGMLLLQGGLVEIVRALHADGDDDASALDAIKRAGGKLLKLMGVSLASGLALAALVVLPVAAAVVVKLPVILVIPVVIVLVLVVGTRWALAVPAAMLEDGSPLDALNRSRALVRGNGWNVFKILFVIGFLTSLFAIPFSLASAHSGLLGWWVGSTLASMLTAPYAAHALTVVYYDLVEPERPLLLEPGHRWQSVWDEQDAAEEQVQLPQAPPSSEASILAEYERKFDERNKQWDR
ncbi:MAG TPA: hypothetical protein VMS63_06765 [Gaiellaceae bacterium]|jgi:hypothetical protein|nr:hypothetical protein [Gaiellaceae bacterium]